MCNCPICRQHCKDCYWKRTAESYASTIKTTICPDCLIAFRKSSPRSLTHAAINYYFKRPKYKLNNKHNLAHYRRKAESQFELIKPALTPGMSMLDIGPGPGELMRVLQKFGLHTDALEINFDCRSLLSSQCIARKLLTDISEVQTRAYDIITLSHSLDYFNAHSLDSIFSKLKSGLSKGGRLFIETPDSCDLEYPFILSEEDLILKNTFFSKQSVISLLTTQQFHIDFIKEVPYYNRKNLRILTLPIE